MHFQHDTTFCCFCLYFEHVFFFSDAILSTLEFHIDDTVHMRKRCYTCTFFCIIGIDSPMTFINVLESLIKELSCMSVTTMCLMMQT